MDPIPMRGNPSVEPKDTPHHRRASTGTGMPIDNAVTEQPGVTPPSFLQSNDLLQGRNSVEISHLGTIYRLRATRQGKLILTK